jgi:hypothetical protein
MQAPPERDAVGRRGRNGDRAQPRDMFMAHLATFAASLNQAHLQPVGSFAEADEHHVVASFPRSYVFARNRALRSRAAPARGDGGARRPSAPIATPARTAARSTWHACRIPPPTVNRRLGLSSELAEEEVIAAPLFRSCQQSSRLAGSPRLASREPSSRPELRALALLPRLPAPTRAPRASPSAPAAWLF